jgi:hypothetical protein
MRDKKEFIGMNKSSVVNLDVSEICYTLFRGKLTTFFAGKEMQQMLWQHDQR